MKRFLSFIIIFALFLSLGAFAVSADETESTTTTARDKWIQDYQEFYNNSFDMPCEYYKLYNYSDGTYYYYPISSYTFDNPDYDTPVDIVYENSNAVTSTKTHGGVSFYHEQRKFSYSSSSSKFLTSFYSNSDSFVFPCNGSAGTFFTVNGVVQLDSNEFSTEDSINIFVSSSTSTSRGTMYYSFPLTVLDEKIQFSGISDIPIKSVKSNVTGYNYSFLNDKFELSSVSYKYPAIVAMNVRIGIAFTPDEPIEITDQVGIDEAPIYYIDDSGDIEEFNIVFVDHKNMLVYCPVTNEYIEYKNISYDYDNFTYNFTTVNEENITLAFNEENITYDYGGNTYNYYYTVNNYNDNPSEPEEDDSGESDNGNIIEWLKKIYNAVRGIDTGNDIDVTINNLTNGEEDTDSFFKTFKLKLQWIRDVYEIAQMLLGGAAAQADAAYAYAAAVSEAESGEGSSDSVSNLATGAPSIYLNLGNANSHYGYDYGGSCVAIDFSWFAAYKPTVDSITGGFLWLLYLWGLVKNVPSIINGMGMTENRMSGMVAKFLDDDRK